MLTGLWLSRIGVAAGQVSLMFGQKRSKDMRCAGAISTVLAALAIIGCSQSSNSDPNTTVHAQQSSQQQPAGEGSIAPKSLDQMKVKYTSTDLTKHGVPLVIDLPDEWRMESDFPGSIDFPISKEFNLRLQQLDKNSLVMPLAKDLELNRKGSGVVLAETSDGFYYRRERDVNGHPYVYIRRDVQVAGKTFSMETEMTGVPRTRDYTDTIWAVAQSLRPVEKR